MLAIRSVTLRALEETAAELEAAAGAWGLRSFFVPFQCQAAPGLEHWVRVVGPAINGPFRRGALAVATPVLVGAMRALGDQIIKAFRGTVRRQLGPSTFKRRPAPIPSYHRSLR